MGWNVSLLSLHVLCSSCLWFSCHEEPSPLSSLLQVMISQNEPKAMFALQGDVANEVLFMQRRQKHSGRKCRCDWRMLLQKWTLCLGKPWSCLLCKYKAVNWIETSPEKQKRKNRLSWGNSPFSKHGGLLLDMPKLPSLTFSSLAIGLVACLETRQEGGQSMNGFREGRWRKLAVLVFSQTHFFWEVVGE